MTFAPTPFATPIFAPSALSEYRAASYISPSWYRFMPTSVSTNNLATGSNSQISDSVASLAQIIAQASAMMDAHCYHRADGSFSAFASTEEMIVTQKPGGSLVLICNFKPIRQVVGIGLGPTASQLANIGQNAANNLIIGEKTIILPGGFCSGYPTPFFGGWPSVNGQVIVVYTYVAGWPHTTLAANASEDDTSITVNPSTPGGSVLLGALAGMPLTIKDGANTETVVLASTPSGLTLSLTAPLKSAHEVPADPDSIMVTALPDSIERACISLVSVILKMQGMRAQVPPSLGNASSAHRQAMGRAGVLSDWDAACKALETFKTSYIHGIGG